jgi:endoglucanase
LGVCQRFTPCRGETRQTAVLADDDHEDVHQTGGEKAGYGNISWHTFRHTYSIPALFGTTVLQSCLTYHPVQLTHYQCEWVRGLLSGNEPVPTWPVKDSKGLTIDRVQLARTFQPWGELAAHRDPIYFGEMGCYKHTPPEVLLTWFDDTLSMLGDLRSGWALWNFRRPFDVLDTQSAGTKFED